MIREEALRVETKKNAAGKNEGKLMEEWEKPSVKEMDINAITLVGFAGTGSDNIYYS